MYPSNKDQNPYKNINIWLETRASHLVNVFYDFADDGKVKERSKKAEG